MKSVRHCFIFFKTFVLYRFPRAKPNIDFHTQCVKMKQLKLSPPNLAVRVITRFLT